MKQFNQPGWLVPAILGITLAINQAPARSAESQTLEMEEVTVWGQKNPVLNTSRNSPQTKVTPDDLVGVNTVMTEDLVKYEPGVIVRQRYIGDSNGTLGMRGSNMFQTTRSMVFADGVPLHYFLQTRWSGAPRWSLVSADEISEVTVIYGPFSAEYGGNAMGGVVNIETAIPVDRQIRLQATSFQQAFSDLGYDDRLGGNKYFASYGDRFESFSLYTSYNHVENLSQPMSFQFSKPGSPVGGELPVTGAVADSNEYGAPVLYFADAGETEAIADQFKFKLGHEYGSWLSVLHLAYEDRRMLQDAVNNYLRDSTGSPVWQGSMVQNGQRFSVSSDDFAISEQDRRSLLLGGRLQGQISDNWWMEAGFSRFRILEDETRNANANPADPAFTLAGDITDYEDTGWKTVNFKFFTNSLLNNDSLTLALGYQHEQYSLLIKNFDSSNFYDGIKTTLTHASGGKSKLDALYAQLGWMLGNNWDVNLGLRYEEWQTRNGFYYRVTAGDFQDHIDRVEHKVSPKFSIGFREAGWQFRYSAAKANRFPIVEELFQNERSTLGTSLADVNLEPENGMHHNLMVEHELESGFIRVNLFNESIEDVIFAQSTIVDNKNLRTFIPIDEVETNGLELIVNKQHLLNGKLDVRLNLSLLDAEIIRNRANTALEGKTFPRMPKQRLNLLLTWRITRSLDLGTGIRYASNSYGDLDNGDKGEAVFGAHDSYTLLNFRANYNINDSTRLSLGVDNLLDEITYVHHPWHGRTIFLEASLKL